MYIQNIMFYNSSFNIFFIFIAFTYRKHSQSVKKKMILLWRKGCHYLRFFGFFSSIFVVKKNLESQSYHDPSQFFDGNFQMAIKKPISPEHSRTDPANNEWAQANASKNPD